MMALGVQHAQPALLGFGLATGAAAQSCGLALGNRRRRRLTC